MVLFFREGNDLAMRLFELNYYYSLHGFDYILKGGTRPLENKKDKPYKQKKKENKLFPSMNRDRPWPA